MQEPRKWTARLGTEVNPYDATKSGPLCPQLGLDPEIFDHYLVSTPAYLDKPFLLGHAFTSLTLTIQNLRQNDYSMLLENIQYMH